MTMLRNFDTELDEAGVQRLTTTVEIAETVEVIPKPSQARTFVEKEDEVWGWEELRDYVILQIEQRHGAFPRDSKKEYGIFNAFITRHGAQAAAIARYAFEVCEGRWAGAPISVNRFCKNSDPYFAQPIAERLVSEPIADWR